VVVLAATGIAIIPSPEIIEITNKVLSRMRILLRFKLDPP
jgi:hypothetical protein